MTKTGFYKSALEETVFVYNASGMLVAEYSTELNEHPAVGYLTADHLGSPRIVTDGGGAVVSRHDYTAFGGDVTETLGNLGGRTSAMGYGKADDVRKQYTGYEHDEETGLDYAQARYYNQAHGRFTSVDPLTASANVKDPQTFNRYTYAMNSPYKFTDPLGLLSSSTGACGKWCSNSDGSSAMPSAKEREETPSQQHESSDHQAASAPEATAQTNEDTVNMDLRTESHVGSSLAEYENGFSIVEKNGASTDYASASVSLPVTMTDSLISSGNEMFDRGTQEASLFSAAVKELEGLKANIAAQGNPASHMNQTPMIQGMLDTAVVGKPISETTGSDVGTASFSTGNSREASTAVQKYNSFLSDTNAKIEQQSKVFASKNANTPTQVVTRNSAGNIVVNKQMPLTERTLKNLFVRRIIARSRGQSYLN